MRRFVAAWISLVGITACSKSFPESVATIASASPVAQSPTMTIHTTTAPDADRGWHSLSEGLLPTTTLGWTVAAMDDDLLVWGPSGLGIVDVTTQVWRTPAAPPIAWRIDATTVWTGNELIFWGGYDGASGVASSGPVYPIDGAAYNPSTDTWRTLASAPIQSRTPAIAAWDGTEMFVWGGWRDDGPTSTASQLALPARQSLSDSAAYNPATDSWRTLTSTPPSGHIEATLTLLGSQPLAWLDVPDRAVSLYGSSNILYSYSKDIDRWTAQATSPLSGWSPASTIADETFVAVGQSAQAAQTILVEVQAASWTAKTGWHPLPRPPLDNTAVCQTQVVAVGNDIIARRCTSVSLLRDGQWITRRARQRV